MHFLSALCRARAQEEADGCEGPVRFDAEGVVLDFTAILGKEEKDIADTATPHVLDATGCWLLFFSVMLTRFLP